MLIKGGIYLEELGRLKAIAFDKTGTLTKGVPVVTDYKMISQNMNADELFAKIAALEQRSEHPLLQQL